MVIRDIDVTRANSVTGNGYYQRRIRQAMTFLASGNPTFILQCNNHREIQKSLKKLNHTFVNGKEYQFNNCVAHNNWLFVNVSFFNYILILFVGLTRFGISKLLF
jgi:hypothetical protein